MCFSSNSCGVRYPREECIQRWCCLLPPPLLLITVVVAGIEDVALDCLVGELRFEFLRVDLDEGAAPDAASGAALRAAAKPAASKAAPVGSVRRTVIPKVAPRTSTSQVQHARHTVSKGMPAWGLG